MDTDDVPLSWSRRFGLAVSPLFELDEISDPNCHHVFLDGGQGTFALSISNEEIWREDKAANWAWSSRVLKKA
jgi:adenine-specific DNA-methyltransferase